GLVARTTHQLAVFVGLEVRQTHDDGLGVEGSGQSRNTFSQFFHEECTWAGVATSRRFHRLFQVAIHIGVVQNSFGVNRNVVVDDEFQTSQTHTIVRNLREVKSQLWVTHVHHDFQADLGHLAPADFFDLGFQQTVVNTAFVAFSTRHRHFLAFFQHVRGVVATNHGGDAQFASNNRRMAGTAATVGDDSRSQLHDGFPVRVRHVGHQHVAGFDQIHLGGVRHNTDFARTDLLANGAACNQHVAGGFQAVTLLHIVAALLGLHRLRTGLQNVDLAVDTITTPLNVHGTLVVFFNNGGVAGQFDHFFVAQGVTVALRHRHVHSAHSVIGSTTFVKFHLDQLGADTAADDGVVTGSQRWLVHVELVRIDRTLNHGFAQAVGGSQKDHVLEARF